MFNVFLQAALVTFVAELGDKTQLAVVGLTAKYKMRDLIIGTLIASLAVNFFAISLGALVSSYVFPGYVQVALALGILIAGIITILPGKKTAKKAEDRTFSPFLVPFSVAVMLVLLEIGDKTQLVTVGLSTMHLQQLLDVYLGAVVGSVAGTFVWLPIIKFLQSKLDKVRAKYLQFTCYTVIGFASLFFALQGVGLSQGLQLVLLGGTAVGYAMLTTLLIENRERKF